MTYPLYFLTLATEPDLNRGAPLLLNIFRATRLEKGQKQA